MQASINALGIIGSLVITTIVIARSSCMPTLRKTSLCLLLGTSLFVFEVAVTGTMSAQGDPLVQWFVPNYCAVAIFLFSKLPRKWVFCVLFLICGPALAIHAKSLLGNGDYTFNPNLDSARRGMANDVLISIRRVVKEDPTLSVKVFPAGALPSDVSDAVNMRFGPHFFDHDIMISRTSVGWYTFFTGIYRVKWIPLHIAYSGGQLQGNLDGITLNESLR